jgi:hypothetical protein
VTVEGIDLGKRQPPDDNSPVNRFSVGISMAGDVTKLSFGLSERQKTLTWKRVTTANKDALETALLAKEWSTITIICDSGDTLGYGATGTVTDNYYVGGSLKSSFLYPGYHSVSFDIWRID